MPKKEEAKYIWQHKINSIINTRCLFFGAVHFGIFMIGAMQFCVFCWPCLVFFKAVLTSMLIGECCKFQNEGLVRHARIHILNALCYSTRVVLLIFWKIITYICRIHFNIICIKQTYIYIYTVYISTGIHMFYVSWWSLYWLLGCCTQLFLFSKSCCSCQVISHTF